MMRKSFLALAALTLLATTTASSAADPRIRYITFNNNAVVTVPAGLGVSTMIQLGSSEVIETISAGDTASWSIVPKKGSGILFVKPLRENAETNVNIVTNNFDADTAKRSYTEAGVYVRPSLRYQMVDWLELQAGVTVTSMDDYDSKVLDIGGYFRVLPQLDVNLGMDFGDEIRSLRAGGRLRW